MPIIINKIGEHRNLNAVDLLVNYMCNSNFYYNCGGRGIITDNQISVVKGFRFTKEMYDKTDGKQINHFIIGTKNEGIR